MALQIQTVDWTMASTGRVYCVCVNISVVMLFCDVTIKPYYLFNFLIFLIRLSCGGVGGCVGVL